MPRTRNRLAAMPCKARIYALIAAGLAALAAGCGSDDEPTIPRNEGELLLAELDRVESLVDDGLCAEAEDAAVDLVQEVAALTEADTETKNALAEAANNLVTLTREQCVPAETEAPEPEVTPEEPVAPPEEETTPPPEEEPEPPEEQPGQGGEDGKGGRPGPGQGPGQGKGPGGNGPPTGGNSGGIEG